MKTKLLKTLSKSTPKRSSTNNQWVAVAISIVLSVTLWFIVTLDNQSYDTDISYPIKVTGIPITIQLKKEIPEKLIIKAQGSGTSLLLELLSLKKDTILIDFQEYAGQGKLEFSEDLKIINDLMPGGIAALEIQPDSISFRYEIKISKMVPVVSTVLYRLKENHRLIRIPVLEPDSILVIGPKEALEKLESWNTRAIDAGIIEKETILHVPLDTLVPFHTEPKEVTLTLVPKSFTEGKISVEVEVENLPENVELRLDPPIINIEFLVPLDKFKKLSATNFSVKVDFRDISDESILLIPKIESKDKEIEIRNSTPQALHYLIIREQ